MAAARDPLADFVAAPFVAIAAGSGAFSVGAAVSSNALRSAFLAVPAFPGDLDRFFGRSFFGFLLLLEQLLERGRRRLNDELLEGERERLRRRSPRSRSLSVVLVLCFFVFLRAACCSSDCEELGDGELRRGRGLLRSPCFDGMAQATCWQGDTQRTNHQTWSHTATMRQSEN